MPERFFFNFLNFFAIFFGIFFPRPSLNGNRDKIFFFLFFSLSKLVLALNNSGRRFFNYLILFERNSGLNFFFSFSAYPILFWLEIILERGFFNFFNFLAIFFGNFLPRANYERNSGLKFFFPLFWPISSHFG